MRRLGPGLLAVQTKEVMPGYQLQFFHQLLGLRTTPDVAFLAANAAVVDSNGATQWPHLVLDGGTSLAAPCWAGLIALVNQERTSPLNAASPTEALSALYSLSPKDYNKIPPPPDFSAQNAGYNTWTGLGSPVATLLLPALVAYDSSPTIKQDPTFPPGTVGAPYDESVTANGGVGPKTFTYAVVSGAIPTGLTFTPTISELEITGTPTGSGSVTFDVTATDVNDLSATDTYSFTIDPAAAPTVTGLARPRARHRAARR